MTDPYPTLIESRIHEEDGKGRKWERHMGWAASKCEMFTRSHMKDSSGDVLSRVVIELLNMTQGTTLDPLITLGVLKQIIRHAPVSKAI